MSDGMTAMPGLSLGIKAGQFLRELWLDGGNGLVVVHRIRGRRRYTCALLHGNAEVCRVLEESISSFPGITAVRANPVTGSITVSYQQRERLIDALFDAISHQISGKHAVQEATLIPTRLVAASNNLNDSLTRIASVVRRFLNHTEPMFWTRMAGLALVGFGISRVMNGERPSGPQLALWGLAMLLRQTHPDPGTILGNQDNSGISHI